MLDRVTTVASRTAGWFLSRPGYVFLTVDQKGLLAYPPGHFAKAWVGLLIVSCGWSMAAIGIYSAAWMLFGEPMGRLMPAALVAGTFVMWPFRRALASMLNILFPSEPNARALAGAVFLLVLTLGLLSLKRDFRHDSYLAPVIVWIRPWFKLYRPIVLMPLWGAWAMLIVPQFCRPGAKTLPQVAAFAKGCRPFSAAVVMGLLLALTITYFNFLGWRQLSILASALVGSGLSGVMFCRFEGGLTRRALLSANVLTQLIFLLACLATCNLVV